VRLDKYLKVSRLVKRRTVANELCDAGRVTIDGKPAKAGSDVKVGQRIVIRVGQRITDVEVLEVPEKAVAAQQADSLYKHLSHEGG
jgi:ribosomal 50S subunit-recycling heat shock protein